MHDLSLVTELRATQMVLSQEFARLDHLYVTHQSNKLGWIPSTLSLLSLATGQIARYLGTPIGTTTPATAQPVLGPLSPEFIALLHAQAQDDTALSALLGERESLLIELEATRALLDERRRVRRAPRS